MYRFRSISALFYLCLGWFCFLMHMTLQAQITSLPANRDRISAHADLRIKTRLEGHLPRWAKAENDIGQADSSKVLHLNVTLKRSPEMQSAFDQLLKDQQDPRSPRYRQWLTPEQVGEQYGPTLNDVNAVKNWLMSQGLSVEEVTPSRMFVRVSGDTSTVANAFSTSIRNYSVKTEGSAQTRYAPSEAPSIPAALSDVVDGISGLSQSVEKPTYRKSEVDDPRYSGAGGTHFIAPADFAAMYNLGPLYSNGYRGSGQKIAVIGRSNVSSTDMQAFASKTGLSFPIGVQLYTVGSNPPGITGDEDQLEATLDVQRVLGTAPEAEADLVIASIADGGIGPAIQYEVNTLRDPIMTISFGSCEADKGISTTKAYDVLFQTAASEGISVFVSSGDSGVAGCEQHSATPPATQNVGINYLCASQYVTCVGGTELNDTGAWGSGTATAYIPEGAWNEFYKPGTNGAKGTSASGTYLASSGGGPSMVISKPSYQAGTGVPSDGMRDTPDISLPASYYDGYLGCLNGSCTSTRFTYFSGTSASTPSMAAIAALFSQALKTLLGNLIPSIYRLAASRPAAFHDVTPISSGVANCSADTPSMCNNTTPGPMGLAGGAAGYVVTAGYDMVTGWGSIDASAFLNGLIGTEPSTVITLSGGFLGTTDYVNSALNFTAKVASSGGVPTGTVQLQANGDNYLTPLALDSTGTAFIYTNNTLAPGTYTITAVYSGDSSYSASTSSGLNFVVAPSGTATSTFTLNPPATQFLGGVSLISWSILATANKVPPTGGVSVMSGNTLLCNAETSFGTGSCPLPPMPAGTNTITALYTGDKTYAGATSNAVSYTVTPISPSIDLSVSPTTPTTASTLTVAVKLSNFSLYFGSSGTVALMNGATQIASLPFSIAKGQTSNIVNFSNISLPAGDQILTAVYSGDTNYNKVTSSSLFISVTGIISTIVNGSTLSVAPGATLGNLFTISLSGGGGFTGPVTLTCAIAYMDSGTANVAPICSLNPTSITIAATGSVISVGTISTTVPSAVSGGLQQAHGATPARSAELAGTALAGLLALCLPAVWRRKVRPLAITFIAAGFISLAGCNHQSGGDGSTSNPTNPTGPTTPATTPGNYKVTITASGTSGAATLTSTSTVALTVL